MSEITSAVVEAIPHKPVTVKMRMGWNNDSIIIPKAGEILEKQGVKAITLHPRTSTQRYNGNANWRYIKELKEACTIPIIGNGDIRTIDDIELMFEKTKCDAVMIGRAAQGNPWIFKDALNRINGQPQTKPPTLLDIAEMCCRHFNLLLQNRGDITGSNLMRKHFANYIKGFPGAAYYRKKLITASNLNSMWFELNQFKMDAERTNSEESF